MLVYQRVKPQFVDSLKPPCFDGSSHQDLNAPVKLSQDWLRQSWWIGTQKPIGPIPKKFSMENTQIQLGSKSPNPDCLGCELQKGFDRQL